MKLYSFIAILFIINLEKSVCFNQMKLNLIVGNTTNQNSTETVSEYPKNLREIGNILETKLKNLEKTIINSTSRHHIKHKFKPQIDDESNFMFYNSLSLIMLSMLAGGLVGVVFILYFTFKKDNQLD